MSHFQDKMTWDGAKVIVNSILILSLKNWILKEKSFFFFTWNVTIFRSPYQKYLVVMAGMTLRFLQPIGDVELFQSISYTNLWDMTKQGLVSQTLENIRQQRNSTSYYRSLYNFSGLAVLHTWIYALEALNFVATIILITSVNLE